MEFDREAKSMIAIIALVAAIAFGVNVAVMDQPDSSFIGWSVGLFVVAVLFWIWIRRDDLAEKRADALKAAEDAAKRAEDLAKKAQDKAGAELDTARKKVEVVAEDVKDSTEVIEEEVDDIAEQAQEEIEDVQESVEETAEAVEEKAEAVADKASEAAAEAEPDDLSKIEGIGPVYQGILKDAGVATFAAIAAKSTEELETIIKDAGKRRPASIETWAEQAGYAAKGDWDGLAKLQSELDGGRRV